MQKKHSLIVMLVSIFLAGVISVVLLLSVIFIVRFRTIVEEELMVAINEKIDHLRDNISDQLDARVLLLDHAAIGAAPYMVEHLNGNPVDENAIHDFFAIMQNTIADVMLMYCSNNGRWFDPGNYVVFSTDFRPPADWDNTSRSWYKDARAAGGKTIFTDPYIDAATGLLVTATAKIVYDRQNRDVGVISENLSIATLSAMVNADSGIPGLQTYLLHSSGRYITNADNDAVMKKDFFTDNGLESYRARVLNSANFFENNGSILIYSAKIPSANWTLVSTIPLSLLFTKLNRVILTSIISALIAIAVLSVILIIVVRRSIKPIETVSVLLKDISEGEGDLTRTLDIKANNEIGELAHYFNLTIEKISHIINIIKKQTQALFDISNDLSSNMTETATAINEITANIRSVKEQSHNQATSITETNGAMEQITVNIGKLNKRIAEQNDSVGQSSAAIEEMLANIKSITQTLIKNVENVQHLASASEVGRNGLQEVVTDIQEIARQSAGLLEINAVMENIASQTNLLSMNAAIEAAHAGEAGKGFAVVADEIRKLAESSGEQSKTISTVLKQITSSIDKISASTNTVLKEFEAIDSGVKTVSEQEATIRAAMEEQGIGSQQILEVIGKLNFITSRVKFDSGEIQTGSKKVIEESRNLESVTSEINNGMNDMANGADQINIAVSRVNELSEQNKDNIDILVKEVSRFKVE
ncbi:MAG: methyl-accepting chemotaxis protein [Treponema sp.]|jgi:methyl-accepting chemotaxis protein|nr:methyl-accepting chemotaxis protein [Treponema sp.]